MIRTAAGNRRLAVALHTQISRPAIPTAPPLANAEQFVEFLVMTRSLYESEGGEQAVVRRTRFTGSEDPTMLSGNTTANGAFNPNIVLDYFMDRSVWHVNFDHVLQRNMRYEAGRMNGAAIHRNVSGVNENPIREPGLVLGSDLPQTLAVVAGGEAFGGWDAAAAVQGFGNAGVAEADPVVGDVQGQGGNEQPVPEPGLG